MTKRYRVRVETDHHLLGLLDPEIEDDKTWPDATLGDERLWEGAGSLFVVCESRGGGQVVVEVWDTEPPADWDDWQGVFETDWETSSGAAQMVGVLTEDRSRRLKVPAGLHRVRVAVADLEMARPDDRGDERYRIQVFPSQERSGYVVRKEPPRIAPSFRERREVPRPRVAPGPGTGSVVREVVVPYPARGGVYGIVDAGADGIGSWPHALRPLDDLLWAGFHSVWIQTSSPLGGVLRIEVWSGEPPEDRADWSWTAEADLDVVSGRVGPRGYEGHLDWFRFDFPISVGRYRLRVSLDDVAKVAPEGRGDELYRAQLFPSVAPAGYLVRKAPPGRF